MNMKKKVGVSILAATLITTGTIGGMLPEAVLYQSSEDDIVYADSEEVSIMTEFEDPQLRKFICAKLKEVGRPVPPSIPVPEGYEYPIFTTDIDGLKQIKYLDLDGSSDEPKIVSLNGLGYLENLKGLEIEGQDLKNLDLSSNQKLEDVKIENSNLTSLDISENKTLRFLYLTQNPIEKLDLRENEKLEYMEIKHTKISEILFPDESALNYLYISDSKLLDIDFSKLPDLGYLYCDFPDSNPAGYDKEKYEKLGNTVFDLREAKSLWGFNLSNIPYGAINVEGMDKLTSLEASGEKLKRIYTSGNTELKSIRILNSSISYINPSEYQNLERINVKKNHLKSLDLSKNLKMTKKFGMEIVGQIEELASYEGQKIDIAAPKTEGKFQVNMKELLGDQFGNLVRVEGADYNAESGTAALPKGSSEFKYIIDTKGIFENNIINIHDLPTSMREDDAGTVFAAGDDDNSYRYMDVNVKVYENASELNLPGDIYESYIKGFDDGSVRPEATLTRAEAAAIYARLLVKGDGNVNPSASSNFSDVPEGA